MSDLDRILALSRRRVPPHAALMGVGEDGRHMRMSFYRAANITALTSALREALGLSPSDVGPQAVQPSLFEEVAHA